MARVLTIALVVLAVLAAGAAWSLEEGEQAPALTITPVNVEGAGETNVIEAAEGTIVLAFINGTQIKGELTDDMSNLIAGFNKLHEEGKVYGVMVVVGEYTDEQIATWAQANNLTVPMGLKQPDDEELKGWDLPGDAAAMLYVINAADTVGTETNDPTKFGEVLQGVEEAQGEQ